MKKGAAHPYAPFMPLPEVVKVAAKRFIIYKLSGFYTLFSYNNLLFNDRIINIE